MVPRVVPRMIATWTWVLREGVEPKIQPRAQSLAQGLMGHLLKRIESQNYGSPNKNYSSPNKWGQEPKGLREMMLLSRNSKSSYWARPFTISQLNRTWNTMTLIKKKWLKHMLSVPLLTSATRQMINNDKFVETKKKSWLGRRESAPMRHAWGWGKDVIGPFMELGQRWKAVVALISHSRIVVRTSTTGVF